MTSPTVTAVSDERLRELRDNERSCLANELRMIEPRESTVQYHREAAAAFEELLRARSALADVGEKCERCGGAGEHDVFTETLVCLECQGTGKQPRPAAECRKMFTKADVEAMVAAAIAMQNARRNQNERAQEFNDETDRAIAAAIEQSSHAAHTAQELLSAARKALAVGTHEDGPTCRQCAAINEIDATLRRLAEQGSGAKDAKEGGK